jgi:hypothetical protein
MQILEFGRSSPQLFRESRRVAKDMRDTVPLESRPDLLLRNQSIHGILREKDERTAGEKREIGNGIGAIGQRRDALRWKSGENLCFGECLLHGGPPEEIREERAVDLHE